jgi:hypothetical protein
MLYLIMRAEECAVRFCFKMIFGQSDARLLGSLFLAGLFSDHGLAYRTSAHAIAAT